MLVLFFFRPGLGQPARLAHLAIYKANCTPMLCRSKISILSNLERSKLHSLIITTPYFLIMLSVGLAGGVKC